MGSSPSAAHGPGQACQGEAGLGTRFKKDADTHPNRPALDWGAP
jgi:hypothetical protein